jgi:putative Mn2+ efflux pump MntP
MTLLELFFIAVGLSMDALAVSMCKGLEMKKLDFQRVMLIALAFGFFQSLMPLIGWLIGVQFAKLIQAYDHWVAFILLAAIGSKMLYEAFQQQHDDACPLDDRLDVKELLILSVATSIDALVVGITFAFLEVNIAHSVGFIGVITFIICFVGVYLGHRFGSMFNEKAEIFGGVVLIGIGLKILLEHLKLF